MKVLLILWSLLTTQPVGGEVNYGARCLAAVGYAEARSEHPTGEACVMRNVINRAVKWRIPICDVVMQDGQYARPKAQPADVSWQRSQILTQFVIADAWPMPRFCYEATHFHQSHDKGELGRIGAHGFYP